MVDPYPRIGKESSHFLKACLIFEGCVHWLIKYTPRNGAVGIMQRKC